MIAVQTKQVTGEIRAIPSKSYAHRALICAALADGPSTVRLARSSVDIDTTAQTLRQLGADIQKDATGFQILPVRHTDDTPLLDCAESGSTLRFLLPVAMALKDRARFTGRGRLPARPLSPLLEEMEKKGCVFSGKKLPLTVTGRLAKGSFLLPGDISSQYISGLLLAAPLLGETEVRLTSGLESAGYVLITTEVMQDFGVKTVRTEHGYTVPGGQHYRARDYAVEGDWSNAAFFLVAGALGGAIRLRGLKADSVQGDRAILDVLRAYGARVDTEDGILVQRDAARPIRVDLRQMPDALPILSVLAASARGESVFYGGARLRLKESDRLYTSAQMIRNLGGDAEETEDGLLVRGTGKLTGGTTSSFGDHRLAMASAIASLLCDEPVRIEEPEAVNKSYPAFFSDFQQLGGHYV
ncbi:MAG: 3-phosphoshikimate 1-carboxyvinyltransferase [Tissierellia bacterium]|nr:3-phosphoshikimate 1-carboxyvinyltransferase [Tissierellia bacterium]